MYYNITSNPSDSTSTPPASQQVCEGKGEQWRRLGFSLDPGPGPSPPDPQPLLSNSSTSTPPASQCRHHGYQDSTTVLVLLLIG